MPSLGNPVTAETFTIRRIQDIRVCDERVVELDGSRVTRSR